MGEYAFDADTRVVASDSSGCFAASLSWRWNGTNGAVNGGYMLAICLRALGLILPFPDPVVVSGFFLRPGTAGAAVVGTALTRSGRKQLEAETTDWTRRVAAVARLLKAEG